MQTKTKFKVDEIKRLNDKLKKEFIEYDSINNMDENAQHCFYEYIINSIYLYQYTLIGFINEISSNTTYYETHKLDKYSINTDSVLELINELIDSVEYKDKIRINKDTYVTYQEETGDSEYGTTTTIRYLKIKIVQKNDLDEILKQIKKKGDFSLNIFQKTISKYEYDKYLNL